MPYMDEEIIKQGNYYKKFAYGNLEEGMNIEGKFYEFSRQELPLEEKISIQLPISFIDMSKDIARIKYPSESRPDIIKMNTESDINFTFRLIDLPNKEKTVEEMIDYFYQIVRQIQPANVFYEKEILPIMDSKLGWFDFKSHGIDCKLYNLMYFIQIGEKALHGIFNCRYSQAQSWKPVALMVLSSLESEKWKGEQI